MEDIMIAEKTIPKGYKNSALGVIPQDWEVKSIKEIVDKKIKWSFTGGPFGSNLKADDYTEEGVRIIQLQNIGDGDFLDKYKIYTTTKKADELLSCNIYPGEIILSKMGDPVARACFIPNIEDRFVMSSDGIRLVPDNNIANKFFVLNYINNSVFRAEALKVSIGSTRRRIGLDDLRDLKLPLPSIKEQKAIADCLAKWDKAIEKLNQLIAQKELRKKGLMQELLTGKKRLKGFDEEWKEVKLGELADKQKRWSFTGGPFGSNLKASDYKASGVRIIQLQNIGDGTFNNKYKIYTSVEKADELLSCNIYPGDIIISKMGDPVGRACLIPESTSRYLMASDGIRLAVNENKYNKKFILDYINFETFRNLIFESSSGSTRRRIGLSDLRNLIFNVPEIQEQNSIAFILESADKEIQLLSNKLEQLKIQKKGLMQVLLTGKKRLRY